MERLVAMINCAHDELGTGETVYVGDIDEKIIKVKAKKRGHRIWKFKTDNPKTRVVVKGGRPIEVPISIKQRQTKDIALRVAKKKAAKGQHHAKLRKIGRQKFGLTKEIDPDGDGKI
jgi:hypothetical protein